MLTNGRYETNARTKARYYGDVEPLEKLEVRRMASQVEQAISVLGPSQAVIASTITGLQGYCKQWRTGTPSCNDMRSAEAWLMLLKSGLGSTDEEMDGCVDQRINLVRAAINLSLIHI